MVSAIEAGDKEKATDLYKAAVSVIDKAANKGLIKALNEDPALLPGMNACGGAITHSAVAEGLDMKYVPLKEGMRNHKGK